MKKLIAFYSRPGENYFGGVLKYIEKGNTEKIAEMICELTGAEMFEIHQKDQYSDVYSECIA